MRRHRKHKHRRNKKRFWHKLEFKIYSGITIMCLVVSGVLLFAVDFGSRVIDDAKRLTSMLPEGVSLSDVQQGLEAAGGLGLDTDLINEVLTGEKSSSAPEAQGAIPKSIQNKYQNRGGKTQTAKRKTTSLERIDQAQIQKLKKKFLGEGKIDAAQVEKLKKSFMGQGGQMEGLKSVLGNMDRAEIERLKKTYTSNMDPEQIEKLKRAYKSMGGK